MIVTQATIRAAGLADVEHILAEYRKAIGDLPPEESANLLWRPYGEFKAAVENGLFFIVENVTGNFMAGAGVFDLAEVGEKELGMCYVRPEWRGYGLQTLLLHIRICAATLGEVPDNDARNDAGRNYAALITGVKPAPTRAPRQIRRNLALSRSLRQDLCFSTLARPAGRRRLRIVEGNAAATFFLLPTPAAGRSSKKASRWRTGAGRETTISSS